MRKIENQHFILGIESSCDETAAAVVLNGRQVLSNIIFSSADIHKLYGGVVPEIASRKHVEAMPYVLEQALCEAGLSGEQISAVAVTKGPGLVGALLVGVSTAKAFALAQQKPLYGIHHLAGHIAANYLTYPDLEPPFLSLIVSGAHSHIVLVRDYCDFQIIARTRDDAPGEAFDKIAREIGLGYPGGPLIDQAAKNGNKRAFDLPAPGFPDSLDFSFSGLKTATLNILNQIRQKADKRGEDWQNSISQADFAATFQHALINILLDHTLKAMREYRQQKLVIAGGVAANSELRWTFSRAAEENHFRLYLPELKYCTDNAAMIASQGYYSMRLKEPDQLDLNASAMLELNN